MLFAARAHKVGRVVYTGSASVYGNPRSIPINEDDGLVPLSPYAVSKLAGEHYCVAFYESYGLPVGIVRYSNVYGPGQHPENPYCGVVAKFLTAAYEGKALSVHGDGGQTRDFTYIEDAVDATLLTATHPRGGRGIQRGDRGRDLGERPRPNDLQGNRSTLTVTHVDRRDVDNIRRRVVNIEKFAGCFAGRHRSRWSEGWRRRSSGSWPRVWRTKPRQCARVQPKPAKPPRPLPGLTQHRAERHHGRMITARRLAGEPVVRAVLGLLVSALFVVVSRGGSMLGASCGR